MGQAVRPPKGFPVMPIQRTAVWCAIALVMLAGCSRPRASQPLAQVTVPRPVVVVVEGDAMVVDGKHIRLSNAYAPRTAPHAHCWAEALAARQAREALRGLIADSREIKVTATGGVDEYNRSLSRVSLDGLDLGQTLHDRGLAALPSAQPFDWCAPLSTDIDHGPPISVLANLAG